jgi:hypothetical protein
MKVLIRRKRITVRTSGYIVPLAAKGPVNEPMVVDMEVLKQLIMGGYRVYEVLNDGTKVELNAVNYDKENGDPANPSMETKYEVVRRMGYHNDKNTTSLPPHKTLNEILVDSTKGNTRDTKMSTGASHFVQKQESNNVSANKVQVNDNTVSEKDKKKDKHNKHGEQFDSK